MTLTVIKESSEFMVNKPFGPSIGHCKLPQELINDFNKDCSTIIKSEEAVKANDVSHTLVGSVKHQLKITEGVITKWAPYFMDLIGKYVKAHPTNNIQLSLESAQISFQSAWYVRSFAGDFNPAHFHGHCHMSCVGYLSLPDGIKEEWAKEDKTHTQSAGSIEMKYGEVSIFSNNVLRIRPRVGDYYLFPWWMSHMVYPFRSKGERRSFSFNVFIEDPKEKIEQYEKEKKIYL
mgnify:FL=1